MLRHTSDGRGQDRVYAVSAGGLRCSHKRHPQLTREAEAIHTMSDFSAQAIDEALTTGELRSTVFGLG